MECACGCGNLIEEADKWGRPHSFVNGHNGRKYEDATQYKREWNHRNRESRYVLKKQRGQKRKAKLVVLAGGKCLYCEVKYDGKNAAMFQFHHRNPEEKAFALGQNTINDKTWKDVLIELEKCNLLCANCHSLLHSEEY